jgi:hypothetical protein
MDPMILTASGIPATYFSGMATPNNTRVETPSTMPIARNRRKKV